MKGLATRLTLFMTLCLVGGLLFPITQLANARPCEALRLLDDATASEILATQRPFAPGNRDLFASYELADWAEVAPIDNAEGPAPTENDTYAALRDFLQRRFPCAPERVSDGLAVYNNPIARQKIADPNLRGALAALTGTLGEPAIDYLLYDTPVATIHFGVVIFYGSGWPPGNPATVYPSVDGSISVVFDGQYRFNPFSTLSALLFHESLHVELPPTEEQQDKQDNAGFFEETIATSLEAVVSMQMLLTDPSIALLPDGLTRFGGNYSALLRLNSGIKGTDRLSIFVPDSDVDIDPLAAKPLTEFAEFYAATYTDPDYAEWRERETYGNVVLTAALRSLAEPGHTPPTAPDFDREAMEFIDQNLAILSSGQLLAVACILQLDVPCP